MHKEYNPLGRRVIVDVFAEQELISDSGIVVDRSAPKLRGKVTKKGGLVTLVAIGDIILFEQGAAGMPVSTLKPDTVWMEEEQIVAIEVEVEDEIVKE